MTQSCDRCDTALDPDQPRYQEYRMEHPGDDVESLAGQLCSDCFWEFKTWLETEQVSAEP